MYTMISARFSRNISFTGIILQLKLDPDSIISRASFMENGNNVLDVNTTASTVESCLEYEATVKYSFEDVYKPIGIELHYQLMNPVPQSEGNQMMKN